MTELIESRLAMAPEEPDGYAWWQAYRLDVTALLARLSAAETEREQAYEQAQRFNEIQFNATVALRAAEAQRDALHADVIRATGILREQNDFNARLSADCRAAEARVEAGETVLRIAYDALDYAFVPEKRASIETAKALIRAHLAARAALSAGQKEQADG